MSSDETEAQRQKDDALNAQLALLQAEIDALTNPAPAPAALVLDEDGVSKMYNTATGGTTFRLGNSDPNSIAHLEVENDTATAKIEGPLHYWNFKGGPVHYASGGSGRTARLSVTASGGSQNNTWKSGAISSGFIGNNKDIKNSEWTAFVRVHKNLGVHTSFSFKLRGGVHSGSSDPRASCTEMSIPYSGGNTQSARELNHPDYDFVKLSPKFSYFIKDNIWLGAKCISYNADDNKSTINQVYIDTDPWDVNGKPKNNWQLYSEWHDTDGTSTGQYRQAALWAGWMYTLRVDGWDSTDFALLSIREIDPHSPATGTTHICPAGQHWDDTLQKCVDDPTGANNKLVYRGGRTLPNAKVAFIYWGAGWNTATSPSKATMDDIFTKMLAADNPYWVPLNQYSKINPPVLKGTHVNTTTANSTSTSIVDTDIQQCIIDEINAGTFPGPVTDPNMTYVVLALQNRALPAPPGVVIEGYHSWFNITQSGQTVKCPYSIITNDGTSSFMGKIANHEIAEAVTDPDTSTGFDNVANGWTSEKGQCPALYQTNQGCEIADLCETLEGKDAKGVDVQGIWSNKDGKCVINLTAGPPPPPPPPGGGGTEPTSNIADNQLGFWLSGSGINNDTSKSTGGFISTRFVQTSVLENLFDNVSGDEVIEGSTFYRCIYLKNFGSDIAYSTIIYAFSNSKDDPKHGTLDPDTKITIGAGVAGLNGIEPFSFDATHAPDGVCFGNCYDNVNCYIFVGDMKPGDIFPLWVKRKSLKNAGHWSRDQTLLRAEYFNKKNDPAKIPDLCKGDCHDTDTGGGGGGGGGGGIQKLVYRGGRVMTNAKVAFIYWGAGWNTATPSKATMDSLFTKMLATDNDFWTPIHQYSNINPPILKGTHVDTTTAHSTNSTIADVDIQQCILDEINAGTFPSPVADPNMIYVVLALGSRTLPAPPGLVINGYHSWFNLVVGAQTVKCPYAIITNDGTSSFITKITNHEIAEMLTDPDTSTGYNNIANGWTSAPGDCPSIYNTTQGCEISDICEDLTGKDSKGVDVQGIWSNVDGKCVIGTSKPPPPPPPGLGPDGVAEIYQSKTGGQSWYLDHKNGFGSDSRLLGKPSPNPPMTDEESFNVTGSLPNAINMDIQTLIPYDQTKIITYKQDILAVNKYLQSPDDWTNVEISGYFEARDWTSGANIRFRARCGKHTGLVSGKTCEAASIHGILWQSGKVQLRKELELNITTADNNDPSLSNATSAMTDGHYVGFKLILYNNTAGNQVGEIWLDDSDTKGNKTTIGNHWRKAFTFEDNGTNWPVNGTPNCSGTPTTKIVWGGPLINVFSSGYTSFDCKLLSAREIIPPG
jgi:hypothetical protein